MCLIRAPSRTIKAQTFSITAKSIIAGSLLETLPPVLLYCLGWTAHLRTHESRNPQSLELRFRALLSNGDVRVHFHREAVRLAR
jgi:hypothetical protein